MSACEYDIIIVGTGAGGGTLLHRLAPSGLRILVLERGEFLPRERENWDQTEVFGKNRYQTQERWTDKDGKPFRPYQHYWVGGNTKVYGAALLRLRASDFERTEHHGGESPAWPVAYRDFEPYYAQAERLFSVHGLDGADPTEPHRSSPYPFPPVAYEPHMQRLAGAFEARGLRPFPCALGVRLGEDTPGPVPPIVLSNFDGYPDLTQAKADAEVVAVLPAVARPNVTLVTGAKVLRLETESSGRRVTAVIAECRGSEVRYKANTVVLSCGAVNSAAVLLRSASDRHPRGLGNSSGLVGRRYMCHNNGIVIAATERENPSQFQKAFALSDYYQRSEDSPKPLGLIQLMGKPDEGFLEFLVRKHLPEVPKGQLWTRTVDFFITAEDLPNPENRVELDTSGGIRLRYTPNNLEAFERLNTKLIEALNDIGSQHDAPFGKFIACESLKLDVSGVSHQSGTLCFGADPKASVLDLYCRSHDVENLYVVDSSFFPSCGAVNPSLTIMANALRVGDRIACQHGAALARPVHGRAASRM